MQDLPTNVIHKLVLLRGDWERKVEVLAMNDVSFVVRPFRKSEHWPYLEELCERFDLTVRFAAMEQAAYFTATRTRQTSVLQSAPEGAFIY